jgi:hypothetical protein
MCIRRIKRTKRTKAVGGVQAGYTASNLLAATLLAADPERYPAGSLMAEWSDMILSKAAEISDSEVGPLFPKQSRAA